MSWEAGQAAVLLRGSPAVWGRLSLRGSTYNEMGYPVGNWEGRLVFRRKAGRVLKQSFRSFQ